MNRIESLDWQRGLLAFAVMAYHLTSWQLHELDASSLLGRLGIYGVSMFFVLSGLSMTFVYHNYIRDLRSSCHFAIRRLCRILPLFWLAVGFAVCARLVSGQKPDWALVALNLSTAFAFVDPSAYMNTGAWSIGNEMVYYALTPLIICTYNKRLAYGNLLAGLCVLVGVLFSSHLLHPGASLASQWAQYINPFNNLFLYVAGSAIFYNARHLKFSGATNLACFSVALALFTFYPAEGDKISIVTGMNRMVFCFASVLLVLAFYKNSLAIPAPLSAVLTRLGVIGYGVYLLHPIVYKSILFLQKKLGMQIGAYEMLGSAMVGTIICALILFKILETPFIELGKRLTSRPAAARIGMAGQSAPR